MRLSQMKGNGDEDDETGDGASRPLDALDAAVKQHLEYQALSEDKREKCTERRRRVGSSIGESRDSEECECAVLLLC